MPNWCDNRLVVTGPAKDLERFVLRGIRPATPDEEEDGFDAPDPGVVSYLSMEKFIPVPRPKPPLTPEQIGSLPKEEQFQHWSKRLAGIFSGEFFREENFDRYTWCEEHWGTKWDIHAQLDEYEPGAAYYRFDSAWSPPNKFIAAVARIYPSLCFQLDYIELGVGFRGRSTARGAEFNDASWNITEDDLIDMGYEDLVNTTEEDEVWWRVSPDASANR